MRRWEIRAALACSVFISVAPGAAADAGGVCVAEAGDPKPIVMEGVQHVRAAHAIECAVVVTSIRVEGRLTMDGRLVASASRTCSLVQRCRVSSTHRDPAGVQAWAAATSGSVTRGGTTRSVRPATSGIVRA